MATVRFSDNLQNDIINNAGRLFSDKLSRVAEDYPAEWGSTVYAIAFRDHGATMKALPTGYFKHSSTITLQGFIGEDWSRGDNNGVDLKLPTQMPFPMEMDAKLHGLAQSHTYGGWTLNADDVRWDSFKAEYLTYCQGVDKVYEDKQAFVKGVKQIVSSYSTLAPALKAWPPLWDLVPDEKQERHKEIVFRVKNEVVVEGVDLNRLTAVSALAKLTGGK